MAADARECLRLPCLNHHLDSRDVTNSLPRSDPQSCAGTLTAAKPAAVHVVQEALPGHLRHFVRNFAQGLGILPQRLPMQTVPVLDRSDDE
jgi:hypothetical protein